MQCPKCNAGTIRQAPVGSSKGHSLVCDNPDCFQWFHGRTGDTTIEEDARSTPRMQAQFSTRTQRERVCRDFPLFT